MMEVGYRGLTMESVRERAGVGKATIYRRWSSKEELVRDAIAYMHDDVAAPDTGSLRGDFRAPPARRGRQRPRAARDLLRQPGQAAPRPAAGSARARGGAGRDPRRRR